MKMVYTVEVLAVSKTLNPYSNRFVRQRYFDKRDDAMEYYSKTVKITRDSGKRRVVLLVKLPKARRLRQENQFQKLLKSRVLNLEDSSLKRNFKYFR